MAGNEGDMLKLLVVAHFERAKLRNLATGQQEQDRNQKPQERSDTPQPSHTALPGAYH